MTPERPGLERAARVAIVVGLLALYELATRAGMLDRLSFVPATTTIAKAAGLLGDGGFWHADLLPTLGEVLAALASGTALGFLLGVLLWRSRVAYAALQPWLLIVYAVPVFALYPLFVALLGANSLPVIVVAGIFVVPAVAINTAIGFRATRPVLANVGRSFGLSPVRMVVRVYVPSAWPHVFSGIKLAASYAIIAVIGTEFILATHGLGHRIAYAYNNFDVQGMYAAIAVVLALAVATVVALGAVERRLQRRSA